MTDGLVDLVESSRKEDLLVEHSCTGDIEVYLIARIVQFTVNNVKLGTYAAPDSYGLLSSQI
jgi:hypothetical protein